VATLRLCGSRVNRLAPLAPGGIFVANADGSSLRQLTHNPDRNPAGHQTASDSSFPAFTTGSFR
jgi:hypothetical protein